MADKFGAGLIASISIRILALGGFGLSAFLQLDAFVGFFAVVLVICAAAGLGNGSVFKIIPLLLPKEAGAAIGIVSCVGALGGFVPPLLLGSTMVSLGSPTWRTQACALFALLCLAVNGYFYHRRRSPTHC